MLPIPNRIAEIILSSLPTNSASRFVGNIAGLRIPKLFLQRAINLYCRIYKVDLSDVDFPEGGFDSFDEFFTRKLKPLTRSIERDPRCIICPSDGLLTEIGILERETTFMVKGCEYRISEILNDNEMASIYEGGIFGVIYLHPRDYHRVHAPVTGQIKALCYVPGTLFPVNQIGQDNIPNLLTRNERLVFYQQTQDFGLVCTVMVGAMGVGRISVGFDAEIITNLGRDECKNVYGEEGLMLHRGEELGVFHLGSTVIFFLPQAHLFTIERQPGDRIRMGDAIVRKRVMHG